MPAHPDGSALGSFCMAIEVYMNWAFNRVNWRTAGWLVSSFSTRSFVSGRCGRTIVTVSRYSSWYTIRDEPKREISVRNWDEQHRTTYYAVTVAWVKWGKKAKHKHWRVLSICHSSLVWTSCPRAANMRKAEVLVRLNSTQTNAAVQYMWREGIRVRSGRTRTARQRKQTLCGYPMSKYRIDELNWIIQLQVMQSIAKACTLAEDISSAVVNISLFRMNMILKHAGGNGDETVCI